MISDQTQNQSLEPNVTNSIEDVLPPFLAYVGINEAARLIGKGKQQIYRDVKSGKLSWHVSSDGKKTLQIADLDRVYKLKTQDVTGNIASHQNQELPQSQLNVLVQMPVETTIELAVLKERVSRLEDENSDLKQTRDRLLDQNQRLTLLLPAPPPTTPLAEPERRSEPLPRPSFWKKLFS